MTTRPVPAIDADSAPFWEGLRGHRVLVQRCAQCDVLRFPPRSICNRCGSRSSTWTECSGQARVASWIVTHQSFNRGFADITPYTILLVRLVEQDDILMHGNLVGDPETLEVGVLLDAVFDEVSDDVTLLHWRPAVDVEPEG